MNYQISNWRYENVKIQSNISSQMKRSGLEDLHWKKNKIVVT